MAKTPFKFLDSYTRDDREIFFGREKEIEELYYKIFDGNLLIVYGSSGTGKTSLIQCGLAGKFEDADWMPVIIRRGENINDSVKRTLQNLAVTPLSEKNSFAMNIRSVYLDFFRPVYLLFDQFEELFIFGSEKEIERFTDDLLEALNAGVSCKFIFVIRGEYLENIARFEEKIPDFFNNRIRVERMTRNNAFRAITEPCRLFNIRVDEGFPGKMLERLGDKKTTVELTYLQVYLDKLYKNAVASDPNQPVFDDNLLDRAGAIDDVLAEFLDEQIAKTGNPERALTVLKSLVSGEGTKRQISIDEVVDFTHAIGKNLSRDEVETDLRNFVDMRILKDQDENGKFELRHDALAAKIYENISLGEKELLEVRQFLINSFNDFQRRSVLLSDADLTYIAPYENKLFLNEEQKYFIEKSKRSSRQKRNRRRNIAVGIGLFIIVVLSGFTIYAIKQRDEAIAQTRIAEQQTQEAINQKELAEKSKEMAMDASKKAMDASHYAALQSQIADSQKRIAQQQALKAQEQTEIATTQESIAEQQKRLAEEKSEEAQREKQKADSAQTQATRFRLLSLSQNTAFKSLQPRDDKQLSALLACEAFDLAKENRGNTQDPQLYSALYENLKNLNSNYQPVIIRSKHGIMSVGVSSSGENILTITDDGSLNTYSAVDYSFKSSNHISGNHATLNTAYISANGKFILTAYDDNSLMFYNAEKNSASPVLAQHTGLVRAAAFSSDGSIMATGGRDSTVIIWKNNSVQKKIHFDARIKALSMSQDNSMIAVGCEDGSMFLLSASSGEKKLLANKAGSRTQSAVFSRQGNIVGFGSSSSMISLFSSSGSQLKVLADNTSSIDFISIDENLNVLVSVSSNKVVHVYNLNDLSQKPIVIKDISSPVQSLILSANGRILLGCADNNVRQFDINPEHLRDLLLTFINRNFTSEEWKTYIGADVPYRKVNPNLQ